MELFENGIGRPTNEILKKRKNFKIMLTVVIAIILIGGSFTAYKLLTSSIIGKEKEAVTRCVFPFKKSTCSGVKNDTVKEIQRILCTKGMFGNTTNCSKEADGDFGTKTENAIKKFQKSKKLGQDGIVGVQTLKEIAKFGKVDYYVIQYELSNYKGELNGAQKMNNNGIYQQVVLKGKVQYLTTTKVNISGNYHVGWKSIRIVNGDWQTLGCYQTNCSWSSKKDWISNRNRGVRTLVWQAGQATGGTGSNGQVIKFMPVYCPTNKPQWNYSTSSCSACPSNKPEYNASTNKCQSCPSSRPILDPTNNKCKACPVGSSWNGKTCACGTGATYKASSNQCVCSAGQKYDTKAKKCVSLCRTDQRYDTKSQKCINLCPDYQSYNTKTKKCVNKCSGGKVYKSNTCLTPLTLRSAVNVSLPKVTGVSHNNNNDAWTVSFNGYKLDKNINSNKINKKTVYEGAVTLYHIEGMLGRNPKKEYLEASKDSKKTYFVTNVGTNFNIIGYDYIATNDYAKVMQSIYTNIFSGYPVAIRVRNSSNVMIYLIAYGVKGSAKKSGKLTASDVYVFDPSNGSWGLLSSYYEAPFAVGVPHTCKNFQKYSKAKGKCENICSNSRYDVNSKKCKACAKNEKYNASNNTCEKTLTGNDIITAATKIYNASNQGRNYSYQANGLSTLDDILHSKMNCASFIALTIYKTNKFPNFNNIAKNYNLGDSTAVGNMLERLGFKKIDYASKYFKKRNVDDGKGFTRELKAGDIVLWKGKHIQLYIGNNEWYNGGSSGPALTKTEWYDRDYDEWEYIRYRYTETEGKFRGVYVYRYE